MISFPATKLARSFTFLPHDLISAWIFVLMCAVCILPKPAVAAGAPPDAPPASYFKDIAPLVREHCAGCHQPSVKQGDLSLTNYEAFMQGGAKGKVIQPGQPEHSLVIGYLTGDQKPQMP